MAEQFITNPSITPGDLNLELSGGYVTAISGHAIGGTGGGGPSVVYTGVVGEITVDNQQGTIGIDDEVKNNINSKASKVELNTTYNTLNEAKQDKLTFGYDDTAISSINGSAIAGTGGGDYTAGIDLKIENNIISVDTNGNPNNTASNTRNFVEGSWTVASGYMNHAEGVATSALGYGVHAQGMWTKFSSNDGQLQGGGTGPIYWGAGAGATVEGYCNATTSCPMSGTEGQSDYGPIHGGVLKVIGNGYVENENHETDVHVHHPSDALIIFKDGTISAFGDIFNNDKKYVTEDTFDNYYSKTETSSKSEISAAIKDFITSSDVLQYNVTAVAGIEVTTATDAGVKTFGISVTSTPVVTDTKLSGFNGIQAYEDGNTSGLWDVGLTQDLVNTINGKLDTTAAEETYQQKGDYATNTLVQNTSAAITALIPSTEGLATKTDLQIVSGALDVVSGELDVLSGELDNYLEVTAYEADSGKFALKSEIPTVPTKVSDLTDSANYYKKSETSGATEISTALGNKVDKPTSLANKYLVLRTDSNGDVSGWYDLQDQCYSKSEANGTFVATAFIDTTTLSGNGKTVSTKLGVNTDVIATKDYVDSSFLPTSGGTVSGSVQFSVASGKNILAVASAATLIGASRQTTEHYGVDNTALGTTWVGVGGDGMHQGFIKYTDGGDVGALDSNSTIQLNLKPSTNKFDSIQIQINGGSVGYLIPAVTSTTTAGLTNDGILHIILES